ncbi:MAG: nucleotidyltransferase domain-containing protein [Planctomycetota bacterium]
MKPDPKLLDELVRRIVEAVHPLRIILFGSAARGEMGPNSDLDVLVVMPDGVHRRQTAQFIYRQLIGFGFASDILVATPTDLETHATNPGLIYKEVLNEGREIYHAET